MLIRSAFNQDLKGDIFLPKESSGKTLIFLSGLPSYLYKNKISHLLEDKGFTVVQPFYYGTWVSGGDFSPKNCFATLDDTMKSLKTGNVTNLYSNEKLEVTSDKCYVIGTSFGSVVAQAYSGSLPLDKRILIGAIPFFNKDTNKEIQFDGDHLVDFLRRGFPYVYRCPDWEIWGREFRGEGNFLNLVNKNPEYLFLQGDKDPMGTQEVMSQFIQKHSLHAQMYMIEGRHALDSLNSEQVVEKVLAFTK